MSRITPSPEGLIPRLQPYIDGELDAAARAAVEAELADDPVLRDMVGEQLAARAALRALPRDAAPQALRARLLLELDAVDREEALAAPPPPRPRRRWRDFLRGGMVMAPAALASLALFALTRFADPGAAAAAPSPTAVAAVSEDMSLESLSPRLVGAGQPAAVDGVSLVSLGGLAPGGDPLTEVMEHRVGPAGARVLELRQSSRGPLPGARRSFRGRDYVVGRDRSGRALVAFDDGLVTHVLVPVGPPARGDLAGLLDLGDRLRSGLKRRR